MKAIHLISSLLFFVTFAHGQTDKIQTTVVKTEIYCNHCNQCNSCGPRIYDHLKGQNKGIRSVKVNREANEITVKYNTQKTNLNSIEESIADAGFIANDLKPSKEAYEKLDACCKKK